MTSDAPDGGRRCCPAHAHGLFTATAVACLTAALGVRGADWPTFRHDPGRTAVTEERLEGELSLQWSRRLPELIPIWLGEFPHLHFDDVYEPIVVGKTLMVASSDDDSLTALDTVTGAVKWRVYTNGPIRMAPAAADGRVFFAADDGQVVGLDIATGAEVWRFDTGLSPRTAFVEGRLGTVCPVRGAPLAVDGKVHVAAGVWSFEPAAFFSLDATTGKVVNRQTGVRGQGYFTLAGDWLYLPNGRASATRIKRDGASRSGALGGWAGYWDHLIVARGAWTVRMGRLQKGGPEPTGTVCEPDPGVNPICFYRPTIDTDVIYCSASKRVKPRHDSPGPEISDVVAYSLREPQKVEAKDDKGKPILNRQNKPETKLLLKELWRLPKDSIVAALEETTPPADGRAFVIIELKAGNRLYGYRGSTVFAIDLPNGETPARVSWTARVMGTPGRMLAADGKLFVVTRTGRLYCFGPGTVAAPKRYPLERPPLATQEDVWSEAARSYLQASAAVEGYCLVLGLRSGRLVEELFRQSRLQIIAVSSDAELVKTLRERLSCLEDPSEQEERRQEAADGTALIRSATTEIRPRRRRISVLQADPLAYAFPQFAATLIVAEDADVLAQRPERVAALRQVLRPYGGAICLDVSTGRHGALAQVLASDPLPGVTLRREGSLSIVSRPGPPEGSADWTHEWADSANTLKSDDHLRAPLGMLWNGGLSARRSMYFDRHVVPPSPVVMGGRMFIAGPQRLVAVDVYTGRILWETRSKLFTSMTRGAGGCHAVGAPDGLYITTKRSILRINPVSGALVSEFPLPAECDDTEGWGRGRVWRDLLVSSVVRSQRDYRLLALNRHTGSTQWDLAAESAFSFVAIGADRLFCWDGSQLDLRGLKAARRGGTTAAVAGRHLRAFDVRNGRELWRLKTDSVVDWLSYSEPYDVLVASTKKRVHAYRGRDGEELWHKYAEGIGFQGHPGRVWQKVILWHDWAIDQRGPGLAYDLLTGKQVERPHPVTLEQAPWEFIRRGHHCNHAVASENFLTFRSSNATLVDLTTLGTVTFPGYRTGCTNSLVPAGGVLSSPMYAHLCDCGYEFYTSVAFAHMPEASPWVYRPNTLDFLRRPELGRVQRLGVNLNAPGERRAENGTLWFGLGQVYRYGYQLSGLSVDWKGTRAFSLPEDELSGDGPRWVLATGVSGLKSLNLPLTARKEVPAQTYTVRLYFLEPDAVGPGERVFSVKLQGMTVLSDLDVVAAAGQARRGIVRDVTGVKAGVSLRVDFEATKGTPVVCGVEVLSDEATTIPPEVHNNVSAVPVGESAEVRLRYQDPDGPGPHTFRITRTPSKGTVTVSGDVARYTAAADAYGYDSFSWVVSDGESQSREAKAIIRLVGPNVPPRATDTDATGTAGKPLEITVPFTDPDEQPGIYRVECCREPEHGTLSWAGGCRFVYTASADFAGDDSFRWRVNDGEADSEPATVRIRVQPDTTAPAVAWVDSAGPDDEVMVVFDEPVDKESVERAGNYTIGPGIEVGKAVLSDDGTSVSLSVSKLEEGIDYVLRVRGIRDRAVTPNALDGEATATFRYVLVGNGLRAEYREGKDFSGKLIGERIDADIDVDWRRRLPFETMKQGVPYSVRWTGRLKADRSEDFVLYFFKGHEHNRNPARVWVDGELLEKEAYGPVSLEAGRAYDLKVELNVVRPTPHADFYRLLWSSLSTPKQVIPQANLGTARRKPGPKSEAQ